MPIVSPWIDLSLPALTIADLVVAWTDLEATPLADGTYTGADGLAVEYADLLTRQIIGGGVPAPAPATTFRLTGIPDLLRSREFRVWPSADNTNTVGFVLDADKPVDDDINSKMDILLGLFEPLAGTNPVTFTCQDSLTGDPVIGVEISVWDVTLTTPVVPKIQTLSSGSVTVGLPVGNYKAFFFKSYSTFVTVQPVAFTVVAGPNQVLQLVNQRYPVLPTIPRITFFGWVLKPDLTPAAGVEVKLRIHNTPQLVTGGAALSRYEILVETDATGRFEMYPVGGATVFVVCESVGYARKGVLPLSGSLNWKDFAIEALPA